MLHISLSAEKIATIGSFPITNSLLATWIAMAILIFFGLYIKNSITLVPSYIQSMSEMVISGLYNFFESIMGHQTKKVFPLIASFFLFIILANWMGLLPGFGTIGFHEGEKFIPLLRGATADLNTSIALAIVAFFASSASHGTMTVMFGSTLVVAISSIA